MFIVLFLLLCIILTVNADDALEWGALNYNLFFSNLKTNLTQAKLPPPTDENPIWGGDLKLNKNNGTMKCNTSLDTVFFDSIDLKIDATGADISQDTVVQQYLKATIAAVYQALGLEISDEDCDAYVQKAIAGDFPSDKNIPISIDKSYSVSSDKGKSQVEFQISIQTSEKYKESINAGGEYLKDVLIADAKNAGLPEPSFDKMDEPGFRGRLNDKDEIYLKYDSTAAQWTFIMDYQAASGSDISKDQGFRDDARLLTHSICKAMGVIESEDVIDAYISEAVENGDAGLNILGFTFGISISGIQKTTYAAASSSNATITHTLNYSLKPHAVKKSAFIKNMQNYAEAAKLVLPEPAERNGNSWWILGQNLFLVVAPKEGTEDDLAAAALVTLSSKLPDPSTDPNFKKYLNIYLQSLYRILNNLDLPASLLQQISASISTFSDAENIFTLISMTDRGNNTAIFAPVVNADPVHFSSSNWLKSLKPDLEELTYTPVKK